MDYLTEDIELLDIPDFQPKYDDGTEYGYKNKPGRNLEKLLRETSKNHCMYCYALLENDRVQIGNMEHSIEKKLSEQYLTECVPNIAISCPNCNQSLKRIGEKKRLCGLKQEKTEFETNLVCLAKKCKQECNEYKRLKNAYCRNAKIILQPFGVEGEKSHQKYYLQYDVYKAEFIPSKRYSYDHDDLLYIQHHIAQFKLNDGKFKTRALFDFVEDVIEADGQYRKERKHSNYIVDLFKEKIKDMSKEQVLKICEQIYTKNFLSFN